MGMKCFFFWSAKNPEGTPSIRGQFSFNYRIFFLRIECLYNFENGASKILLHYFSLNTCFLGSFRPIACKIGSLSSVIWLYHVNWELGVECVQSVALWNDSGRDKGPKNMVSVKCI